jgi:hypothetical protein
LNWSRSAGVVAWELGCRIECVCDGVVVGNVISVFSCLLFIDNGHLGRHYYYCLF